MGVIDLVANSATYIGDVSPYLPLGGVAGIAQSGSVTDAFVHSGSRVGFSRIISCGSEVVLDVCDYLAYCLDDPETHSVILFVEGFKRPERFLALADRALELGKPIMAVKVGRSQQAQVAAIAHSGSLAGEARVTDAALDAAGVIVCADLDQLLETAELVEGTRRTGRAVGRGRTGVVTVSTGEASLIADQAPQTGIDLPPLPDERARGHPGGAADDGLHRQPARPVGRRRAGDRVRRQLRGDGGVGRLRRPRHRPRLPVPLAALGGRHGQRRHLPAARGDRRSTRRSCRSTCRSPPASRRRRPRSCSTRRAGGAPLLRGGIEAFTAIASVARWEARRDLRRAVGPWRGGWPALAADRTSHGADPSAIRPATRTPRPLSERESLAFLGAAGIAVTESVAVRDASEAVTTARRFGRAVALKLDAAGVVHKSEVGGVALGLVGDDAVYVAALGMLDGARRRGLEVRGLLVQPMASPGLELILGLRRDPLFGASVLVGLGGVLTEVLDDVAIRLAPVTPRVAMSMLDDLRGRRLLDGVRGRPGVDRAAVAEMLVALGRLGADRPDVLEVDLNPVIASPAGVIAVDALVVLEEGADAGGT